MHQPMLGHPGRWHSIGWFRIAQVVADKRVRPEQPWQARRASARDSIAAECH